MSQKFKSEVELQALNNATTDTDKFLVSDSGVVKYRTGNEVLSDLGITLNTASKLQHQVKAGVAINKGQAVYVTSADGTNMIVGLASNASEATSSKTMGLLDATVAINGFANVVTEGLLDGLNTVGANAGDPVWLGTGGNLIYGLINKPYAPAHLVFIGIVTRVNVSNGEIFVNVQNGFELNEIHDVDLKTTVPISGDILGFNGTLWVNKTIAGWLGYTPANANGTVNYVSKFTGATTLGNSLLFDNGTNVGIGTSSPSQKLHVVGNIIADDLTLGGSESTPTINFTSSGSARASLDYNNNNGVITLENKYGLFAIKTGSGGSSSERMRITSAGNVGIGTAAPSTKLEVNSGTSTGPTLRLATTGISVASNTLIGEIDFYNSDATTPGARSASYIQSFSAGTAGGGDLRFGVSANAATVSETMRITSGGNVGIGTTAPSFPLSFGTGLGNKIALYDASSGSGYGFGIQASLLQMFSNAVGDDITFGYGNSASMVRNVTFKGTGNVGIGTTAPSYPLYVAAQVSNISIYADYDIVAYSDQSVKENIRPIENALERVIKSRGVLYDRTDSGEKDNIGFIAQELEVEFPELVVTNENGTKAVKYQNTIAVLFEAIKEQQKQIEELKQLLNGFTK